MAAAALTREGGEDAFRRLFRFYRQRDASDLRGVVDFSVPGGQPSGPAVAAAVQSGAHLKAAAIVVFRSQLSISSVSDQDAYRAGLQPVSQWKAYGLNGYPGFIFIPNPFLPGCQRHWVKQCLKLYPQKPNVCNLDLHMAPEKTIDLWGQSKEQLKRKGSSKGEPRSLLEKLRWVTLGYHYNWDTKKYSANHHTPFPSDLAFLSEQVAAACGFRGFQAQAGILNYYHFDSSLGIHVDESELDHSRPLLSFSFGQSSIFLLGGLRREEAPTAMFMHSGDIMVMSGFSRLLYHAVPRVLPNPEGTALPSCLDQALASDLPVGSVVEHSSDEDWQVCAKYLQSSRINMTIRQVLAEGQKFPEESGTNRKGQAPSEESHRKENSRTKRHKPNTDS
ncbi:nucleic acid dioxygenase ALKBH1 isoform X1 [Falco naumanni]|uniref:nucleic acid dioxygenase ALKBH1 isoform X1 n=1 Tax=Falco naumanni TaxID=148594 RepID=UPI001ADE8A8B|nr:nucleic acid dioxygenase ALKBH1 isoform X1 [Falco naumanni]